MSNWRMAKGLVKGLVRCNRCGGHYSKDEFSDEEDLCLYCLFPETGRSRPTPMNYEYGAPRNLTGEGFLLENYDRMAEKQSKEATRRLESEKNRNLYK